MKDDLIGDSGRKRLVRDILVAQTCELREISASGGDRGVP